MLSTCSSLVPSVDSWVFEFFTKNSLISLTFMIGKWLESTTELDTFEFLRTTLETSEEDEIEGVLFYHVLPCLDIFNVFLNKRYLKTSLVLGVVLK